MKKVVEQTACDRCGTQIAEGGVKQAADENMDEPVLFAISGEIVASTKGIKGGEIVFVDLCEKCRNRIKSLIAAVMKSGKTGPKKARTIRTKNAGKGAKDTDKDKGANGASTATSTSTAASSPA